MTERETIEIKVTAKINQDAEINQSVNGHNICKFELAVPHAHKNKFGQYERNIEIYKVVIFNDLAAEFYTKLKKGKLVKVTGIPHFNKWVNRHGCEKASLEIIGQSVEIL